MEWSNDMVLEFLHNFETEPVIWNPKHPNHKKKHLVFEAWRRLKTSLSFEESTGIEDLKRKKDSLMAYYRIHLNKMRNMRKSGDENSIYKTDWFAFSAMNSFLAPVYKVTTVKIEDKNDGVDTGCYSYAQDDDNVSYRSSQSVQSADDTPVKKKRKQDMSDLVVAKKQLDDAYSIIREKATTANKKEDMHECDLYAELLARKLKKLDEERRTILMHNIDNLVFQEFMSAKTQERAVFVASSYSRSPSPSNQ